MADSTSGTPPTSRWRTLASGAGAALVLVISLLWWLLASSDESAPAATPPASVATPSSATAPPTSPPAASERSSSRAPTPRAAPTRVLTTLELIDSGQWPDAANAPGTRGGMTFRNNEGRLPAVGADGRRLRFQEWDVNPKAPGRGRDAERIVTANDGSAWYTLDHYRSFVLIRGPAR